MVTRPVCVLILLVLSVIATGSQTQVLAFSTWSPGLAASLHRFTESTFHNAQYVQSILLRKYVNSFTSYQFPNPYPPNQDPLSHLEFPIDQWFLGFRTGYDDRWWSAYCEGWINVSRESQSRMQDSDWDDEQQPNQKTIFSESKCRLNEGRLLDVCVAVGPPLQGFLNLRPILGYRYQRFHFTTHDGFQAELAGDSGDLPGDGIEFEQTFYHYYFGAKIKDRFVLARLSDRLPEIQVLLQIDYAGVIAKNEDLHLLRVGDRVTTQNTRGHCWHGLFSLGMKIRKLAMARIEGDFKRIITRGSHRLTNSVFGLDFSFDGSKVWSDQASISAVAEIAF